MCVCVCNQADESQALATRVTQLSSERTAEYYSKRKLHAAVLIALVKPVVSSREHLLHHGLFSGIIIFNIVARMHVTAIQDMLHAIYVLHWEKCEVGGAV